MGSSNSRGAQPGAPVAMSAAAQAALVQQLQGQVLIQALLAGQQQQQLQPLQLQAEHSFQHQHPAACPLCQIRGRPVSCCPGNPCQRAVQEGRSTLLLLLLDPSPAALLGRGHGQADQQQQLLRQQQRQQQTSWHVQQQQLVVLHLGVVVAAGHQQAVGSSRCLHTLLLVIRAHNLEQLLRSSSSSSSSSSNNSVGRRDASSAGRQRWRCAWPGQWQWCPQEPQQQGSSDLKEPAC